MGGPWKARDFDPLAWRRPAPRPAARAEADDQTTRLVIGYIVAVLASCGMLLILLARLA